jgi:hypothetical protein
MPRVLKIHKPFFVDPLGHFFQYGNAAGVVFYEVIIGGEYTGEFVLGG